MAAGPSVEADIWQHYQTTHPGQVQVIAGDMFSGSAAAVESFRTNTGATYPLCLFASSGAGTENWYVSYADRDNWLVINKQGIIRYHANDLWPYGSRYHLDQIRGCVDSLVTNLADVDESKPLDYALSAGPSPFRSVLTVEFTRPPNAAPYAHVTVHDLAGRRIATLWNGPAPSGRTRMAWDRRAADGTLQAPGLYLIRCEVGGVRLGRRVIALQ